MNDFKLVITKRDWILILFIGALFGFFISFIIYLLNKELHNIQTVIFGIMSGVNITVFAIILISACNNLILPNIRKDLWYFISFLFSFLSGSLGFFVSYILVWFLFDFEITSYLLPYISYICIISGVLTFFIGLILHLFVTMKNTTQSLKNEILESKIKVLENELNPHFLFNSLTSVSELIYNDQKLAEKSVINLSKFLRNAISEESLISTSKEIQMVKTYVEIENIRFENKINLHIKNENENFKVPKFSIQLLVENGIKHGFDSKELDFYINITSKYIRVSNNGIINKNIKYGTGLNNLDRRLKLLNVGRLNFSIEDNMMSFYIYFEEPNENISSR